MQTHYEESMRREIDRIRDQVGSMAALAESALNDCVKAFVENDHELAYAVILRDLYVDEKEKEIDRLCLEFLVRQQPVAQSLRFAYSTIKINLEIERIGDYAESIARYVIRLKEKTASGVEEAIVELANLSIAMFHDSIEAFLNPDPERAWSAIEIEDKVDALRTRINRELARLLQSNNLPYDIFDPLAVITRRLERVSDQARNICMEALYMCTGQYAKHPGTGAFRILFIDNHNSCRGPMAEAIAIGLNQPRFIFSSAGAQSRPMLQATIEFMNTKGFDLSRTIPRSIQQIPHIEHYQVVVALSEGARKIFPQCPRKTVFLEWLVSDPSETEGTPETVQAAYEETFMFIQNHIKALVQALIGSEIKTETRKES
ncbi:MAG: phosphate transport system regulatory protein PhoU [Candidatus Raymondbacteria bacterium RifOxyA12_full_50_37]|uniref:Phosphate transport system regulatory protein PhoU n=1 Tax=Candidatus Raymondbacteria bacterium RIFOXYD12_FULL_49_13 TaxID=1817890 RepID=A0A1F7F8E6_UNCRA|nr:MAG: phosphate transport system regulatory protein PhoU [Candidatus Raymondbacteria bacterium RifOxyA12_full_50_37]OGJ91334.1 MAG: phosphate transport system regulatory protein PhoU [Candidatus Raymondbacteria bacterium RIFOXYA2_FULL_49_16]OGJ91572.1 MAG: phosphate transport system regulatory protein PhoU [Candidatus Raymondbacteria bacterium RifOxyB12_full_50_8]OGJ97761.1 MAG: phosphate transport system regulatory protein PhoU [Candidatus Raymondbacteria bacterium RIFOXYC2_FULL_50_21]OGK029